MRDDKLNLEDIVAAAQAIERYSDRLIDAMGLDEEIALAAILQKLMVIGEAAARISPDIKKKFAQVEWQDIVGFRNYAIHVYFSVDWEVVRSAALFNAPHLREQISAILLELYGDQDG